jgi:hypothetical protein
MRPVHAAAADRVLERFRPDSWRPLGEQLGTGSRELHIGSRLVQPQPAQLDCEGERGAELVWRAAFLEEGAVDPPM